MEVFTPNLNVDEQLQLPSEYCDVPESHSCLDPPSPDQTGWGTIAETSDTSDTEWEITSWDNPWCVMT